MSMRPLIIAATFAAAVAALASTASAQGHAGHLMTMPADLKWADVPSLPPGAKIAIIEGPLNEAKPFTFRLRFPANYQIPAHSQPAAERVTVLSGTFHMGTGDKFDRSKTTGLSTGSVAIMQPGTTHFAWTDQETVVQLNGTGLRCPQRFVAGSFRVRSTREGDRTDEEAIHRGTDHWLPARSGRRTARQGAVQEARLQ